MPFRKLSVGFSIGLRMSLIVGCQRFSVQMIMLKTVVAIIRRNQREL
jgi:hypothetical protein